MSLLQPGVRESGFLMAVRLLPSHVTSDKTLALSGSYFPHLYNRDHQAWIILGKRNWPFPEDGQCVCSHLSTLPGATDYEGGISTHDLQKRL